MNRKIMKGLGMIGGLAIAVMMPLNNVMNTYASGEGVTHTYIEKTMLTPDFFISEINLTDNTLTFVVNNSNMDSETGKKIESFSVYSYEAGNVDEVNLSAIEEREEEYDWGKRIFHASRPMGTMPVWTQTRLSGAMSTWGNYYRTKGEAKYSLATEVKDSKLVILVKFFNGSTWSGLVEYERCGQFRLEEYACVASKVKELNVYNVGYELDVPDNEFGLPGFEPAETWTAPEVDEDNNGNGEGDDESDEGGGGENGDENKDEDEDEKEDDENKSEGEDGEGGHENEDEGEDGDDSDERGDFEEVEQQPAEPEKPEELGQTEELEKPGESEKTEVDKKPEGAIEIGEDENPEDMGEIGGIENTDAEEQGKVDLLEEGTTQLGENRGSEGELGNGGVVNNFSVGQENGPVEKISAASDLEYIRNSDGTYRLYTDDDSEIQKSSGVAVAGNLAETVKTPELGGKSKVNNDDFLKWTFVTVIVAIGGLIFWFLFSKFKASGSSKR